MSLATLAGRGIGKAIDSGLNFGVDVARSGWGAMRPFSKTVVGGAAAVGAAGALASQAPQSAKWMAEIEGLLSSGSPEDELRAQQLLNVLATEGPKINPAMEETIQNYVNRVSSKLQGR